MTTVDILIAARKKIEKPENWVRNEMGLRNGEPKTTYAHDFADCDCFCSTGALAATMQRTANACIDTEPYSALVEACGGSVTAFNDTHTHAEVLAAFDRAIELARSSPTPNTPGGAS